MNMDTAQTPFFPIVRLPLFTKFNDQDIPVDRDALLNADTGEVLGNVGRNYKIVTNTEVDNVFQEAFQNLPIESTRDHLNAVTNRWQRDIVLHGDQFTHLVGGNQNDQVKTKVSIWNGYDGKTSVGFAISGYRMVCTNGMMGWRKLFGENYTHMEDNIVDRIRGAFDTNLDRFNEIKAAWDRMAHRSFTKVDFERFVMARVRNDDNENGYLSERQARLMVDLYEPILNRYNDDATEWGAYNILTNLASHHTKAREGSHIFSAAYRRMEHLTTDFFADRNDLFDIQ